MNNVLRVSAEDLDVTVQAGVTRKQLNEHLKDAGLFFPIDPGADASLGGMAATRASGTNAVRYGTMRENVLGLTVVTADGRVIKTGGRARKSAAGYDLTRIFVGSEGTLGRHHGGDLAPLWHARGDFRGGRIVSDHRGRRQHGDPDDPDRHPRRPHRAAGRSADGRREPLRQVRLPGAADPVLRVSRHRGRRGRTGRRWSRRSPAAIGAGDFHWASKAEERNRLWQARHNAYYACKAMRPGSKGWATDVCVPISRLAECISETKADLRNSTLLAPIVGHVGDGNFHVTFLVDPGPARRTGGGEAAERAHGHAGPGAGRHLHRGTWHRLWQAGLPHRRAWRRRRGHAASETGAGSRRTS